MDIDVKNGELTIRLSSPIQVYSKTSGGNIPCEEVVLKQPNMRSHPKFEKLANLFKQAMDELTNKAMSSLPSDMKDMITNELEKQKIKDEQEIDNATIQSIKHKLEDYSINDLENEINVTIEQKLGCFNWERAIDVFEKMIGERGMSGATVASVSGEELNVSHLHSIVESDLHDYRRIVIGYIIFFDLPAKSRKKIGSAGQYQSHDNLKEV